MAQKAAKQLAARNTAILNRAHLISLALHALFILIRILIYRASFTRSSLLPYILLGSPGLIIEFWFEKIGRPSSGKAGEDLEAKGLTEYLWDVLYWTWGCVALAVVVGDRAWWLWGVVPLYSGWLAWTTYGGMRSSMSGMMGQGSDREGAGESKRQKKMEKRGGQKVQYR